MANKVDSYFVRFRKIIHSGSLWQLDEASDVVARLVSVAVVLADRLVEAGALTGAHRVAKLVESQRGLRDGS